MKKEEFIEYLKNQNGKQIILDLKGIITTKLEIKEIQIKYEKGYLILKSKENELLKVK